MSRSAGRFLFLGLVGLLLLSAALLGVGWREWSRPTPPDAPRVEVEVPRGASLGAVATRLEAAGLVPSALRFRVEARLFAPNRPVRYGVYAFPKGAGGAELLRMLQEGEVMTLRLLVPEGMPSVIVHARLMAAPRLVGDVPVPAEGSVLPATWTYRPGETRAAVLQRMQAGMTTTLDELWAQRSPAAVVRTPEEALILASIVEKETGKASERRTIAGLYSNRLRAGMRLEADPTVIYPVTQGRPLGRRILRSELAADTGFNTYVRAGLPRGPITNPGRDSIAAVLDPERHNFLFMVADGSGGHAFAADYAGHQANVAKWYALRRARGEM
jgi:UPF0755 protein